MPAANALGGPGIAALAGAAALILATYALLGRGVLLRRRGLYAGLRAAAFALLVFALSGPERTSERRVARRHALAVLVDDSASLRFPLSPRSPRTRLDALEGLLKARADELARLGRDYDLAAYRFAGEPVRSEDAAAVSQPVVPPGAEGDASAIGEALLAALDDARGKRLVGAVVLSDGVSNLGASPSEAARAFARVGVPVHAIALGEALPVADLGVAAIDAPRDAPMGRPFRLGVRIRARAAPASAATVLVRAGGEELGRARLDLPAGDSEREAEFHCTPKGPGTAVIEALVEPLPAEFVRANNRRVAFVEVRDTTLRVVYAEGVLRQDYRAVRRALSAAEGIDLDVARAFVKRRAGADEGPAQLAGTRWGEYDVVVLGELPEDALSDADAAGIRKLVAERGRGLVVLSGPGALASSPARGLVPATISDPTPAAPAKVVPTAAGRTHPGVRVTERASESESAWSRLGPLGDLPSAAAPRGGAEALLEAGVARPVLVAGGLGSGRVAALLSGRTHVWADDPDAPPGAYARLLRSLVAWSAGRESARAVISVDVARRRVHRGDLVSVAARVNRTRARELGLSDAEIDGLALRAEVAGPLAAPEAGLGPGDAPPVVERIRLEQAFGEHEGSLVAGAGGVYRVRAGPAVPDGRLAPAETLYTVEEDEREFARIEADPDCLERLARGTGGAFATAERPEAVFRALADRPSETVAVARRRSGIWDTWWVATLFLASVFAEWAMRRR